jgi:hypothetical protein
MAAWDLAEQPKGRGLWVDVANGSAEPGFKAGQPFQRHLSVKTRRLWQILIRGKPATACGASR